MNHFGKLFSVNIFGESHGESVGVVIDGCPAGMPLAVKVEYLQKENAELYKNMTKSGI